MRGPPFVLASHYSGTKRRALSTPSTPAVVNFRSSPHLNSHCPPTLKPNYDQATIASFALPDLLRTNTSHTSRKSESATNPASIDDVGMESRMGSLGKRQVRKSSRAGTCSAEPISMVHETVEAPLRGLLNSGLRSRYVPGSCLHLLLYQGNQRKGLMTMWHRT